MSANAYTGLNMGLLIIVKARFEWRLYLPDYQKKSQPHYKCEFS
jgi:hypothetical protein